MKRILARWLLFGMAALCLNGCVAIPPLIQVQHKDNDADVVRKLDEIDKRLKRVEEKLDKR